MGESGTSGGGHAPAAQPSSSAASSRHDLFHVHAIGSRGFASSFPIGSPLADGVLFHNYEPDAEANAQTEKALDEHGFLSAFHPVAAFDRDGAATLNLNYDPYTSSLLPPDPSCEGLYFAYPPPAGDYAFTTAAAPVRHLEVATVRLDRLAGDGGFPVDWIAMDTQGTEFEILLGAQSCCATTLVGFSAEVEFLPLYQGQKLFGDVAALAASHGFRLAGLRHHPAGAFRRAPLGWRGNGFLVAADALFLRSAAAVRDGHPEPRLGLRKLAFASLCHGHLEHALEALEAADAFPALADEGAWSWQRLLDRMLDGIRAAEPLYPVAFTDLYAVEDSWARFAPDCRDQNEDPARTARRFFSHTDRNRFEAALPMLMAARPTVAEKVLMSHGLDGVAALLRRNRQDAAFASCRALGWFAEPSGPFAEAARRVGRRMAAEGPVGFYGTGEMFVIADSLLGLPSAAAVGLFDGTPARHGTLVRGRRVSAVTAADLSRCASMVLCTQASETAMCRSLLAAGYQGRVIGFAELLERIADEALDGMVAA